MFINAAAQKQKNCRQIYDQNTYYLSQPLQRLGGLRRPAVNSRGIQLDLIPSTLGGRQRRGGQLVLSFEAKLKRGSAKAALTTEQRRDTNIYAEKPHTHTRARADTHALAYAVT